MVGPSSGRKTERGADSRALETENGEWRGRVSLLREVQQVTKAAIACLLIPPLNARAWDVVSAVGEQVVD